MRHFPAPLGQPEMMRKNFMRSGICLYSWCTVPRMKFVFCLSARGVQFGFLLKLCAWKGKVSGMSTKFVFVTGGVVSGLGKGICAASLGRLLKQRGVRVRNQKFDPYINVDPGTMSPYQHGEVFVTEDGAETDLDLGHYERFVDEDLTGNSSVSSGKIYWSVLNRERRGDYLGATVQIIPHITDEIKRRIYAMAEEDVDVVITEIGGTVGDIESQPFLEAIRQVAAERPQGDVVFIHVPLIVQIPGSGELKSKPTQHSVKELLSLGIQPDILVCRCDVPITEDIRRKIALFCNVQPDCVIQNATAETLYEVPLLMAKEGLDEVVCRKLGLITHQPDLREWSAMVKREKNARKRVSIALVGKYTQLHDAYLSVVESLNHAGTANDAVVDIRWVDSETLTEASAAERLAGCSGILVPGGFGDRGIEGMIAAVRYAREHCIPYFGICLGSRRTKAFHAELVEFPQASRLRIFVPVAGGDIRSLDRQCVVVQPMLQHGPGRAGGSLRTQGDGTAAFIIEGVHLLLHHIGCFPDRSLKQHRMFKNRRADFPISGQCGDFPHKILYILPFIALLRENILCPFRGFYCHVTVTSCILKTI